MAGGDLTPIAQRLAALIPRLASAFEGEVVATARAIDRTLRSAGRDWHDVAAAIAKPVTSAKTRTEAGIDWRGEVRNLLDGADLSVWERGFCVSILGFSTLSERQQAKLGRILEKHARAAE